MCESSRREQELQELFTHHQVHIFCCCCFTASVVKELLMISGPLAGSEAVQLRQQPLPAQQNIQLRRSESSKTNQMANSNASINSSTNLSMPNVATSAGSKGSYPKNLATTATSSSGTSSQFISTGANQSPAILGQSGATTTTTATNPPTLCLCYFACSRYFLFLIYFAILLSFIVNIFLHFIIFGSNMSIAALFLDVHHRYEMVIGDYYSFDLHNYPGRILPDQPNYRPPQSTTSDYLRCDRNSFLSLLDEFYHQYPKPNLDNPGVYESDSSDQMVYGNRVPSNRKSSYPKMLDTFKKYANRPESERDSPEEEQLYFSSSSTHSEDRGKRVMMDNTWNRQYRNEQRLLVIEVVGLVLLFLIILNQVIGLIAVMKKHLLLLIFVTSIQTILFATLVFISNFGLLILLLLAILVGFHYIVQLKCGYKRAENAQRKFKDDIVNEVGLATNRNSPCVHVSMEQYEQMTQQMLHRYSSPIVYCPHYNESLC